MMKMKNKILITTIVFLISASGLIVYDCYPFKISQGITSETGTIKYIPLEGGFYGIITEKGEKYLPLNLAEEYKEDGLKVWFKGKVGKDVATIYQWGKPVEILEIRKVGKRK